MNNFHSLQYFIPEIILFLNVFFLFFLSGTKKKRLVTIGQTLLLVSILTVLVLYLTRWFDRSYGLFYNSIVLDPFSTMFSIMLLLIFMISELPDLWTFKHSDCIENILQKFIILTASILIVKANSAIAIIFCMGLIFIGNSIVIDGFPQTKKNRIQIINILRIQILSFGLLFFGFSIIYGATTTLSGSPINYCFLTLFLILGLGLFGIILPFMSLRRGHHHADFVNHYGSSYFLPFLAIFGSLIRILNSIIPLIQNGDNIPIEFKFFVAGLSICLMAGANLYYIKRKTLNDLFSISIIIHYGLVISGLAVFNKEAISASIYLIVSTTIALIGITILQKHDKTSTQSKLLKTVFYLILIGMPGTSGFTGRFLLLRSLYNAGVSFWLIVLLIISICPIIYFYTIEIFNLHRAKTVNTGIKIEYTPAILSILSFLMVVCWEPFIQLITKSLVFFN